MQIKRLLLTHRETKRIEMQPDETDHATNRINVQGLM